ncbi:MAG TPA: putative leader peptide [Streptosporangiaceae bacterium]
MAGPPTIKGVHPGTDNLLTRRRAVDFCRVATALCRA